jgi:hypothetical protein
MPHSRRRNAWFALVILLAAAALGLFAAGVGLLGTDPDECSASAEAASAEAVGAQSRGGKSENKKDKDGEGSAESEPAGRRLADVHAMEPAELTRAAAIDRTPHPPAAEARAAVAAPEAKAAGASSSKRRRLCEASECTGVANMAALFEAMRVAIVDTGDVNAAQLIAALRTFIPFNKFGGLLSLVMTGVNDPVTLTLTLTPALALALTLTLPLPLPLPLPLTRTRPNSPRRWSSTTTRTTRSRCAWAACSAWLGLGLGLGLGPNPNRHGAGVPERP